MSDTLLFYPNDLPGALRASAERLRAEIMELSPERVNGASDDELVDCFVSKFRIEPLHIYGDKAEMEHQETKVDVSGDLRRAVFDRSDSAYVKGEHFILHIPFTGNPDFIHTTPSHSDSNPPRGRVEKNGNSGGVVLISCSLPSDKADDQYVNSWIKDSIKTVEKYAGWVSDDVGRFNGSLEETARSAIEKRREQLEKQGALLKKLSIPIKKRSDAPSPIPVPMPKRVVKPLPPGRVVEQEYGLRDEDYEFILRIIRHVSRSYESTPRALTKLAEEDLRDLVLGSLNTHFDGGAAGERFRKGGKTDICNEHENRAAFVAECKLWKGKKALNDAMNQLLGYLTWRDTSVQLKPIEYQLLIIHRVIISCAIFCK